VKLRKWLLVALGVVVIAMLVVPVMLALTYVRQATDRGGNFDPSVRGADWHKRGLRTMAELFPTRTVSRGGAIAALPEAIQDLSGLSYDFDGQQLSFGAFLERSYTHGIVVLHEGAIVYERYFSGADASTRFTSWSVAKSSLPRSSASRWRRGRSGASMTPWRPTFPGCVGRATRV
jgi:hypothetical protein